MKIHRILPAIAAAGRILVAGSLATASEGVKNVEERLARLQGAQIRDNSMNFHFAVRSAFNYTGRNREDYAKNGGK